MRLTRWSKSWRTYSLLTGLVALTLFILACGDDATPTPTSGPAATATPTPTTAAPAATATPTPTLSPGETRTPTPTATARATETPRPAPTSTPTVATVPVESQLKIAMVPPGNQVTMHWKTFQSSSGPLKPMYDMLINSDRITLDFNNEMLAESWAIFPDGRGITFNLKKGVPFHSTDTWTGTEFTSKDVITSIRTIAREDSLASGSIFRDRGVADKNFETPDDYTFIHKFDKIDPLVEFWYGYQWVMAVISDDYLTSVGMDAYEDHPIGTGPYKFVELKINEFMLQERVDNHWRKTGAFEEVKFFYVPEGSTRLAMLLADEVAISDVARDVLPTAVERGFKIATATRPSFYFFLFIPFYYDSPREIKVGARQGEIEPVASGYQADDPFRNVLVRKALNLSIDRDLINETFWAGTGVAGMIHNLFPGQRDYKENWVQYPFDPEAAKAALAEAGFPNGFEFDFVTAKMSGVPEAPQIAEAIAAMWSEVGIKANIKEIIYGDQLAAQRNRDLGRTITTIRYGGGGVVGSSATTWCFPMNNVAGGCGSSIWEYEFLEDPYIELSNTVDLEERVRLIGEIGDMMYDNYIIVPMHHLFAQVAYDPRVIQGYEAATGNFGPSAYIEFIEPVFK